MAPRVQHLKPAKTALEKLVQILENGTFKVGDLLPSERVLAEQLGVSRMVVRDVTKKLEQRGMVSIRQGIGVRVIDDPSRPLQQAFATRLGDERTRLIQSVEARILLEPELAARAAKDPQAGDLRELAQIHQSLRAVRDIAPAVDIDIRFHEKIAEMARNEVLALILASLAELGRVSRQRTITNVGTDRAYEGHGLILAAIKARDPSTARRRMQAHLKGILEDLP
jgi:GntR family transcriptional regulator, transcriptional repressor for pyruvate dehydrogenase complex